MSKHTPGPWIAAEWDGQGGRLIHQDGGDFMHVANVPAWKDHPRESMGSANARLIAAAPEMLDMLDEILNRGARMDPISGTITPIPEVMERARALLARIEGDA